MRMKMLKAGLILSLTLLPGSRAEETRFFRIAGPVATTITALSADGSITWTNAPTNATFTVQTALSLLGQSNWFDYVQVTVTNSVTTHRLYDPNPPSGMALIPAGSFTMGNCMSPGEGHSDELPLHTVNVSAFHMDMNLVSKAQWDEVYQWAITNGYGFDNAGSGKAANHPVQTINWYDAVKWCNARSEKEGLSPVYYTADAQTNVYRTGRTNVLNDWVKWTAGYRLPTEAEWEKAARGGTAGHRFPWSDTDTISHSRANYYADTNSYAYDVSPTPGYHPAYATGGPPYTSPVGSFAANGYGLFDMAGNAFQWCWDWYDITWYGNASATQDNTRGPAGPLSQRVLRGGVWDNNPYNPFFIRCAYRYDNGVVGPSHAYHGFGFRCVRAAGQ